MRCTAPIPSPMNRIMAGGPECSAVGVGRGGAVGGGLVEVISGVGLGSAIVGVVVMVASGRAVAIPVGMAVGMAAGGAHAGRDSRISRGRVRWNIFTSRF